MVCDGLKGLPEVVSNVWPQADRANLHHPFDPQHFSAHLPQVLGRDQTRREPIYTAVNAAAARSAFDELADKWGQRYPAVIRLWDNACSEFVPFLDYDVEIRRVICTTNAVVIWSARISVFDVRHGCPRTRGSACWTWLSAAVQKAELAEGRSACCAGGFAGLVA